jgi:probable rRNA maturation factor
VIETAVINEGWDTDVDWETLSMRAVSCAVAASPFGPLADLDVSIEVSVKFTSDEEVRALNRDYRHKDQPTNVLSFPMVQPDLIANLANSDDEEVLLGDIVLAKGVCTDEAKVRNVSTADHATHLIVHGTLHLLGYDHIDDAQAEAMEFLEQQIMASLGLHDPYQPVED